jgi:HK97 gp10 family phage protein
MSISVQVNLSSFDVQSRCFDCLCEQYPEAVGQAMMNVAQNILATANTLVPVRTGYLKSTIEIEQPNSFQIKVKATAPYAYYVEFGTKKMSAWLFLNNSVNQYLSEFAPEIAHLTGSTKISSRKTAELHLFRIKNLGSKVLATEK